MALPTLLILLTLVWVVASVAPVRPWLPHELPATSSQDEGDRLRDLAAAIASGAVDERRNNMLAMAGETQQCPGYAPFTVPRLAAGLKDPDARIRAAAAYALGALGPRASGALPSLREAHGSGPMHVDHVLVEAIWWVEHGETVESSETCPPLPGGLGGDSR